MTTRRSPACCMIMECIKLTTAPDARRLAFESISTHDARSQQPTLPCKFV